MKTLAQLKRVIQVGTCITLVDAPTMPDHKYLNVKRFVHSKDTTGIYLNESMDTVRKGSFLPWPKASKLAYENDMFDVYADNADIIELSYKIHA